MLKIIRSSFVILVTLIAGACSDGNDTPAGTPNVPRVLTVTTTEGEVVGVADAGVFVYQGIPYARPPVGALRWAPPQSAIPRSASLLADKAGNSCVQMLLIVGAIGDEDCLLLNVATPQEGDDLPVLVWLHGGGFILGSGAQADGGTLGDKLARESGAVVVSINYRLGAFGFLAHSDLSAQSPNGVSGNYGLMDQTMALQWVRDNIAAFGGDPDNVTLFGESAGAFSTCIHIGSEKSAGLFHRAIVQSGNCLRNWPTVAGAETQGDTFAQKIGCDTAPDVVACMRDKQQEEVLTAFPAGANFGFADLERSGAFWWPVLDGDTITMQTADSLASDNFNKVPVIYGFNRDEGQLFTWLTEADPVNPLPITADNYEDFLTHFFANNEPLVAQALAQYDPANYAAHAQALGALSTDAMFRCPARQELTLLAQHVPTYLYQFDYEGAAFQLDELGYVRPPYGLGAFHSAEIQYVFGRPASISMAEFEPGTDYDLWQNVMGYWGRFAATGNPNGDGALHWPEWTPDEDQHMAFNISSAVSSMAAKDECEFWRDTDYLTSPFFQ